MQSRNPTSSSGTNNRTSSGFIAIIVTALVLVATAFIALGVTQARAANNTISITVGEQIPYAGYSTGRMTTSQGAPVFCADPSKSTPESGTYEKLDLMTYAQAGKKTREEQCSQIRKVLYYGWGSPGFEPDVWPDKWYDGSKMTDDYYIALEHILLSEIYSLDASQALTGTNSEFQTWACKNVLGVKKNNEDQTEEQYPNATRWKIDDLEEPADTFNCYVLAGTGGNQPVLTFDVFGWIEINKKSSNTSITSNNECYSRKGAEYGIFTDKNCTDNIYTLVTDESGYAKSDAISGGTYYVKETKAPTGCARDETVYEVKVKTNKTTSVNGGTIYDAPQSNPISLLLVKYDEQSKAASDTNKPQGGAALEGASFKVQYYDGYYKTADEAHKSGNPTRSWTFKTDSNGLIKLTPDYLVSGDDLYRNSKKEPVLALGTYLIQETQAPAGYFKNDEVFIRQVTSKGTEECVYTYNYPSVPNKVKRGDIEFIKAAENNQERLGNVVFRLTSKTTKESHILVTDENGHFTSANSYNKHSESTNANDNAVHETEAEPSSEPTASSSSNITIDEEKLNPEAGIWFGLNSEGSAIAPDDSRGALPFDTYILDELPCSANQNKQLISGLEFSVSRDNYVINYGTIDDPSAYIATSAHSSFENSKYCISDEESTITDTITYEGLIENREYTMKGTLHLGDDTIAQGETTFTPTKPNGSVDVVFTFNSVDLANATLWVSESLLYDNHEIAKHEDPEDTEQQITVIEPSIGTSAHDNVDNDQIVVTDAHATIIDEVTITNAIPGTTYTLTGQVMVKTYDETGTVTGATPVFITKEGFATTSTEEEGATPLTTTKTITPESVNTTQTIEFAFNAEQLGACDLVVYETLIKTDTERVVASHEDPTDEGQSIQTVETSIETTATDALDGDKTITASPETSITDTIGVHNAIKGAEYRLDGQLMVKVYDENNNVIDAKPLLVDEQGNISNTDEGTPVTSQTTFTASGNEETHEVTFTFSSENWSNQDLVVYETLTKLNANNETLEEDASRKTSEAAEASETEVAKHCDPADENQSIQLTAEEVLPPPETTPNEPTPAESTPTDGTYDKTGYLYNPYTYVALCGLLCAIAGGVFFYHLHKAHGIKRRFIGNLLK